MKYTFRIECPTKIWVVCVEKILKILWIMWLLMQSSSGLVRSIGSTHNWGKAGIWIYCIGLRELQAPLPHTRLTRMDLMVWSPLPNKRCRISWFTFIGIWQERRDPSDWKDGTFRVLVRNKFQQKYILPAIYFGQCTFLPAIHFANQIFLNMSLGLAFHEIAIWKVKINGRPNLPTFKSKQKRTAKSASQYHTFSA